MKRAYVFALAAIILASSAAVAKMPKGAFLNSAVAGTEQLTQQVMDDPIVAARYAKHFGMSRDYVVAYFQSGLMIGKLKSDYETTIYKIKGRTDILAEQTVLREGTYVFLSMNGQPILEARSGDPLGRSLPTVLKSPPQPGVNSSLAPSANGTDEVVTKVLGSAPIEAGTPAVIPVVPADALSPVMIPSAASFPEVEVISSIPAAAGSGGGAGALIPLALLGALAGGGGGGSSSPPAPAEVPEPSSLVAIAMAASGVAYAGLKRRR